MSEGTVQKQMKAEELVLFVISKTCLECGGMTYVRRRTYACVYRRM